MKSLIKVFRQDIRAWILVITATFLGALATNHSTEIETLVSGVSTASPIQGVAMGLIFIAFISLAIHCFSDSENK